MAKDPYKYFRVEAAEILDHLAQGVLELDKGAAEKGLVAALLRFAHTLKGASQVVKQPEIAQAAHAVEDILGPYRESGPPVPKKQTSAILQLVDQIGARLAELNAPAPGGPGGLERAHAAEISETVRVEVEEMDELLARLSEASIDLAGIQSETESLRRARQLAAWLAQQVHASGSNHGGGRIRAVADEVLNALALSERRISAAVERAERELGQARERASRLRLLPAESIIPALARAAREAASALGKQVEFAASGGDVRLDASVLEIVRDALLHLVRNALAHGIESPEDRATAGKPRAGAIAVQIRREGSRATFVCRDDGRGMDLGAIRRAAVKKGAISEREADTLGVKDAIDLLLKGGVSTSAVTRISGRGIGLDVVRDAVERLKGEIRIDTAAGQGTTVEIRVPVSLTSVAALVVASGGTIAAIPLEAVREAVRLADTEIADTGTGQSMAYAGRAIPFLRLSEALGRNPAAANGNQDRTAVIVTSGAESAAVGMSRLVATGTILVRSLPAAAAAEPLIAGAALDSEGNPLLVLDPVALIVAAQRSRSRQAHPSGPPRSPILVIDDSLTTRMVEQTLLESAGHRVECAASAEEAIEKAHQRRYSLFLVDVEMPGMDGYQFVSRAHDDPLLRETPSILVTSRSSAADRRRGEEVGARAYIAKSEFDQAQFLETIRRLVA